MAGGVCAVWFPAYCCDQFRRYFEKTCQEKGGTILQASENNKAQVNIKAAFSR